LPDPRLFFALWPDEAMQAALAGAVSAIVREAVEVDGGRAVPAKNFHLTLAFLGAVPLGRVDVLMNVAARCAEAFSGDPLSITLDTVEHWRKPQVLVATSSRSVPDAIDLASALTRSLTEETFVPDLKPFHAHATFARKVRRVTRDIQMPAPVHWSFTHLHLIESRSGADSSAYSSVEKWALYKPGR
jgi:2'-5' RNA ligase